MLLARSFTRPPFARPFARSFASTTLRMHPLTPDDLNPAILKVQYAVRGELAIKAEELRDKLKEPNHGLPFDKVISSNIGNPQQKGLDQKPITFVRQVCVYFHRNMCMSHDKPNPISRPQVAALTEWPALADLAPGVFPPDVVARAKELLQEIGSIGAYSHSQGVPFIRKNVAKFIEGMSIIYFILSFNPQL